MSRETIVPKVLPHPVEVFAVWDGWAYRCLCGTTLGRVESSIRKMAKDHEERMIMGSNPVAEATRKIAAVRNVLVQSLKETEEVSKLDTETYALVLLARLRGYGWDLVRVSNVGNK